jgi:hypothetical protein
MRAQVPTEVRIRSGDWFPPGMVFSAEANLVELAVIVRDRRGRLAGGLHATDFEILDDNQPREITFFFEQKAQSTGPAPAVGRSWPTRRPLMRGPLSRGP